ncbi:hypothetical protein [Streptomyces olivochromogenes]|uniref:hypothetical protein n=1 Tax=Streptomyces olivochromogenes TaxID=1963 RepID=UPI001F45B0BD|nr:hypothetical protein [Streptomyces olivochromogenes]MCF3130996.1 hypothetical protein [Streptomyces olivochromogenes]
MAMQTPTCGNTETSRGYAPYMALIDPAVTPILTLAGLAVSTTSLIVATYVARAGGPKVTTQCYFVAEGDQYLLRLVIHNGGRSAADVTVQHLHVRMGWDSKPTRDVNEKLQPQFEVTYPFRLEGHSTVEWSAPASELVKMAKGHILDQRWYLYLTVGRRRRKVHVPRRSITRPNEATHPLN